MHKVLLAASAILLLGTQAGAANISLQFDGAAFHVTGWDASKEPSSGWPSVFSVYAGTGDVPMLGSYEVSDHVLTFHPRFPISAGVRYRAVFHAGTDRAESIFDGPPNATNRVTRVDRVYPSANVLPSNVLRLYVYFSAPMSRGEAWQHIHLIDADTNHPIELPFLELDQELWDQSNQRLTVLFDPGRIKRGLVPTNTIGPAVVEGKHYQLVIDRDWHDARGVGLTGEFKKSFSGGPSDRIPPEPKRWRITAPKAGTTEALVINFPNPMDYVLLQRMIGIFNEHGEISGSISVASNETEWRFTPNQPWLAGSYRIEADNILEDISGNHLDRPFDVDLFETVTEHISKTTATIPFLVVF